MPFTTAVSVAVAIAVTNCVNTLPSGIGIIAIAPMMAMLGHVVCVDVSLSQVRRILWSLKDPPFRAIRVARDIDLLRLKVPRFRGFSTIDAVDVCQGESPSAM
jgi:hypothetical protein